MIVLSILLGPAAAFAQPGFFDLPPLPPPEEFGDVVIDRLSLSEALDAGSVRIFDPAPDYRAYVASRVDLQRIADAGLKVAYDPMWGAGIGWLWAAIIVFMLVRMLTVLIRFIGDRWIVTGAVR